MKSGKFSAVLLCGMLLFVALAARAQSTVGSIYGTVTDTTGAGLPGAAVLITEIHTRVQQACKTDEHGLYVFTTVLPGEYKVNVTAQGFKAQTQSGVVVASNANVHVPVTMVPGGAEETIEVQAGVTLVDTREAQIGETINQRKVQELPILNRDTYSLLQTVTGVQGYSADTLTGSRDGTDFSVNGFPASTPSFYLDGAYNNAFKANGGNKSPSPDSLEEVHVITGNFDAEFGRSPGAVVNLITKSGTDQYHGAAYDYIRNDAFDAKGFFNTQKATLRQQQYGATFGGTVPGVRDKLFFFLSFEHLTYHSTATVNGLVTPTAAERTGDFSSSASGIKPTKLPSTLTGPSGKTYQVQCGTTAAPKICSTALDAVAQNLLQFLPVYNNGSPQLRAPSNVANDAGLGRIDYHGFANHSIYATFFNSQGTTQDPTAGGNQGIGLGGSLAAYSGMLESEDQLNAIIADDWTVSPHTINSIRGYYTSNRYVIGNQIAGHFLKDLGSGAPEGGAIYAPPYFSVTGDFTLGPSGAGPSDITQLSFGLIDTATLQRGTHAIKIGGSWNSNKYTEDGNATANGTFTFTGATSGSAIADFLLGVSNAFNESSSVHHRTRQQNPAVYVQDDWQVTRRLNLNVGLRYEVFPPWLGDNTEGTFQQGQQSTAISGAPAGLLYVGDKGVTDGIIKTAWNRFAPRVGLAWDLYGDGRTSLRAGYGIFYSQFTEGTIGGLVQEPYSISQTTNTTPGLVCPYGGTPPDCAGVSTPFPFTFNKSNTEFYTNTNLSAVRAGEKSTPYANEFNLTVEQQLSRSTALRLSYVGSTFIKQYISMDMNTPQFYPGASITENVNTGVNGLNCRRPYQPYRTGGVQNVANCKFNTASSGGYTDAQGKAFQFAQINELIPINNQSYNSLQADLHGRVGKLDLSASYVWGKALNFTTPTVDQSDIRKNHGAADIDIRNRFVLSALYPLPQVNRFGRPGRLVLGGWSLSTVTILQSGSPFNVNANVDVNRDGNNNDRVNVVGDPYTHAKGHVNQVYGAGYLNSTAFQQPCGASTSDTSCTYPYGNEQRNSLYGPPNYVSNLSVFKEFGVVEPVRFQLRAEAFNVFNYTHLTSIRNNLTVFPTATNKFQSADAPRRLQFAAKVLF